MNSLIESLFQNFEVNGVSIPVYFMYYNGHLNTYITYQQESIDNTLSADDSLLGYVDYYDVDVYSEGNYFAIIQAVIELMESGGFTWQPSRSSGDMYDEDTKQFHKTLNFAIEREVIENG